MQENVLKALLSEHGTFHTYTSDCACACFAAVVSGESGDDIYEQVKVVIEEQVGPSVWVSTNQPL